MTIPQQLELAAAYRTDPGRVRKTNQDWAEIFWADDATMAAQKGHLFLVADGMGGHASGEQASKFAVQRVGHAYRQDPSPDVKASLGHAIAEANAEIYREAATQVGERGAGTTMVGLVIRGRRAIIVNVGDSRAYLLRAGHIRQITEDHSWVAEQKRAGKLTAQQAQQHELRSTITRAVGADPHVTPDFFEYDIRPGDIFALCTDGLTKHVSDANIEAIVTQYAPEEAANRLVQLARQRGGTDNVTAMVVQVKPPGRAVNFRISELFSVDYWRRRPSRSMSVIIGAAIIALLLLCSLAMLALRGWGQGNEPAVVVEAPMNRGSIRYRVPQDTTLESLAKRFGYGSIQEFTARGSSQAINLPQDDSLEPGRVPAGTEFLVNPAQPFFLMGGPFNKLVQESNGETVVWLSGQAGQYPVSVQGGPSPGDERVEPKEGDLLRILAEQSLDAAGKPHARSLLIQKHDAAQSVWPTWYRSEDLPREAVWVYGSLSEGSFGQDIVGDRPNSGRFVAAYGRWVAQPEVDVITFEWEELYLVDEDNIYVLGERRATGSQVQPTRAPTATLRPIGTPTR